MSMEIGVIETEIMTYLVQHRTANLLDQLKLRTAYAQMRTFENRDHIG